ncbi:MAG: ABC transporter ATP-binding protein [Deltaproteobacteria bacterium]|nr:ABC transporter ATP-binding protein [Deltaproteobacteria bacterium]
MPLLEAEHLSIRFGGLKALDKLDIQIEEGEILGLIGPNGAGKSTFINVVSGFHKPSSGRITLNGENIVGLRMDQIASKGIIRTFQVSNLFMSSSVLRNIQVGFHLQSGIGFWGSILGNSKTRRQEQVLHEKALEISNLFNMGHLSNEMTANLPHGHQRELGVAMALAAEPKLLMLDEPVTGMIAEETLRFMNTIRAITKKKGTTTLLIEHDMKAVMGFCDRIVVLNFGKKIAEGTPEKIQKNQDVIKAYLGEKKDAQNPGPAS